MSRDKILDEVEYASLMLDNISRSATLIDNYCKTMENIYEFRNLTHLTSTMANELNILCKQMNAIVKYEKYNEKSFEDIIWDNLNSDKYEMVDD